jgi:hypothetical protein
MQSPRAHDGSWAEEKQLPGAPGWGIVAGSWPRRSGRGDGGREGVV